MANSPNLIQRTTTLATFLATAISDGTYSDVIETIKVDAAGQEAAATDIADAGGQLVANLWDDTTLRVIEMYDRGTKVWLVADATERDALGSDDDLAANDLAFQADTTGILYCVSVDGGAASTWAAIAATGNVVGPGASTDNAIARWDGAGGATIQDSLVIVDDTGNVSGVADLTLSGTVDGRDVAADGVILDAHVADIANPHATNLAQVLLVDPDTAGTNIGLSNGDAIVGDDGGAINFAAVTGVIEMTDVDVTGDVTISGKLTVAGLIDPTGLVLDEQATSPFTAAGKGTVWTKNTSPTQLWFTDDAGNDSAVALGSTAGLAVTLAIANLTGGNDLVVSNGDSIVGEPGSTSVGGPLALAAGNGDGTTNSGGVASLTGGVGAVDGDGGIVAIIGGAGGSNTGAGGPALLQGGDASGTDSDGGQASVTGGQATGAGSPGNVVISAPGAISGNVTGGMIAVLAGQGVGTGGGGGVAVQAGDAGIGAAGGGGVFLTTGDGGSVSGDSGDIELTTGAVSSGSRGVITLDASAINLDGAVTFGTQHYSTVRGSTARGSTNTLIYRWTAEVGSSGTDVTYADSATLGGTWTINTTGIYTVSACIVAGHTGFVAIKAGAISNTFDETSIVAALGCAAIGIANVALAWTGLLTATDVVWLATNTATNPVGTPANNNRMTITRIR